MSKMTKTPPRTGEPMTEKEKELRHRTSSKTDEEIDEAIEESFPASDPPSYGVPISPARTTPAPKSKP